MSPAARPIINIGSRTMSPLTRSWMPERLTVQKAQCVSKSTAYPDQGMWLLEEYQPAAAAHRLDRNRVSRLGLRAWGRSIL